MVNGQNEPFEFNFVVEFQIDHFKNLDFDNSHGQDLDYFTTADIPRFWPWSWLKYDYGH